MCLVSVLVDTPQHSGLSAALDYLCPHELPVGALVRVPLGRRTVTGVVWPRSAQAEAVDASRLKPVVEVLQGWQSLPLAWCQLVRFAAAYYQRGMGEVAMMVLPPELRGLSSAQWDRKRKRLDKLLQAPPGPPAESPPLPELTPEQATALQALAEPDPRPVLLWGSTGSGKTEVYLRQAQALLAQGRQVLIMVPEINLTPQLQTRVAERFPGHRVAALHSGLTPAQRLQNWWLAHLGHADIVLGTRLSVFTPLPRLGLIVVDEEHDPSYKQQDGARYSARDLAIWRAQNERVTVILGSATPSLESWFNALPVNLGGSARYRRLDMPSRVGQGDMPRVRLLDQRQQPKPLPGQEPPALARPLLQAMEERLARGEQSLVLLNRRGYAPVLQCSECGWKSGCPQCSAWRVFHKGDRTLRCHHCGLTERVPRACPDCGNADIHPVGRGTERLEEQLAEAFPTARVARIDADVTRHKGALEERLDEVHAGDVDILVGTQMVAKGHDFRRVTLVAAVNPDTALFASDFRAAERQFALLMQAAGRAGRDAQVAGRSEMWVQTWHADHALYQALRQYDFAAFAGQQLLERQMAGLPPHAHLAMLRAEARTQEAAQAFLQEAAEVLEAFQQAHGQEEAAEAGPALLVYPPVPTAVQRVALIERAQMLIESPRRPPLQRALASCAPAWLDVARRHKGAGLVRWAVDVDPLMI